MGITEMVTELEALPGDSGATETDVSPRVVAGALLQRVEAAGMELVIQIIDR
jgi:hypothetical protein